MADTLSPWAQYLLQAQPLYAIIDGARNSQLPYKIATSGCVHRSLYEGESERDLAGVAPYLVRLSEPGELLQYLTGRGWGQSLGVFLRSGYAFQDLRQHLRRYLMVRTPSREVVYFRFYDPRVLRTFIPSCRQPEAVEFFGPIQTYWVEGARPQTLIDFTSNGCEVTSQEYMLRDGG